jgi:hypothetical protein
MQMTDDMIIGSLYWCAQGTREPDVNRSLPLHTVTDIYVGKNTPLLMGEGAKDARKLIHLGSAMIWYGA